MFSFLTDLVKKLARGSVPSIPPETAPVLSKESDQSIATEVLHRLSYASRDSFLPALKLFQSDQGLKSDGKLNPATMAKVRLYEEKLKFAPTSMKRMRRFRATHYYVAAEVDYSGPMLPVYDINKKTVCVVPASFFCNSALEGTGKLKDGRLMNVGGKTYVDVSSATYAGAAAVYAKHIAYMKSKGRDPRPSRYFGIDLVDGQVVRAQPFNIVTKLGKGFGIGKKSIPHETNRTCATDQGLYGTSEPRFKGKGGLWPAGTRGWVIDVAGEHDHDGWITAADVGGGIFGAHFDFFVGMKEHLHDYPVRSNAVTYVWFDGIEDRIAPDYDYGLYDR